MHKKIISVLVVLFLIFAYTLPFVYAEDQILTSISVQDTHPGSYFVGTVNFYKDKITVENSDTSNLANIGIYSRSFTYKDATFRIYIDRFGVNMEHYLDFYETMTALLKAYKADNSFINVPIKEPSNNNFTYSLKAVIESCSEKYIDELNNRYDNAIDAEKAQYISEDMYNRLKDMTTIMGYATDKIAAYMNRCQKPISEDLDVNGTAVQSERDAFLASLGDRPTGDTFEDFIKAAQLEVLGQDVDSKYHTDIDRLFDSKQQVEIKAAFYMLSHIPSDVYSDIYEGEEDNALNPDYRAGALAMFSNYTSEHAISLAADDAGWKTRMRTFSYRVQYYYSMLSEFNDGLDADMEALTHSDFNSKLWPAVPKLTNSGTNKITNIKNFKAYTSLLDTCSELGYFSSAYVRAAAQRISGNTASLNDDMIICIRSLYEGIEFINADETWEYWNKQYDVNGTSYSLASIYDLLEKQGAFANTETYDSGAVGKPFAKFFNLEGVQLSSDLLKGIEQSATYIPMKTNVYDPETVRAFDDTEFINGFHYKYGFHRKALYMDTNVDAAVDTYVTGRRGELQVATLKDLLKADKDIVLYVDDNYYNVKDLADMQDKAYSRVDNGNNNSLATTFKEFFTNFGDYSILDITKTAEKTKYSSRLKSKTKEYNGDTNGSNDNYFLSSADIDTHLNDEDYNVLQTFAVLSGIYRDSSLFDYLNGTEIQDVPVFISSPKLADWAGTSVKEQTSIFNYMYLKNIEANTAIDYSFNLDMQSPLYLDIYGNILTESGIVVVPAAANATLHSENYEPRSAAFLSTYGKSFELPDNYTICKDLLTKFFKVDEETKTWKLLSQTVEGTDINLSRLSTSDKETLKKIKEMYKYNVEHATNYINFKTAVWDLIEVLRGAPIDNIDKDVECLNLNGRVNKNSIYLAAQYEELLKTIEAGSRNYLISIPNIAYLPGFEYLVFFIIKIVMFACILIMICTVYIDAVRYHLSLRTFGKCIGALLLTCSILFVVPAVFQLSYNEANKFLLQNEAEKITMLNLEKEESGVEVGVTEVSPPDLNTKLYLRLSSVNVNWVKMLSSEAFKSSFGTVGEAYKEAVADDPIVGIKGVEVVGNGIYMNVSELFNTSSVNYQPSYGFLYQTTDSDIPVSFYTPYYVFLDAMIANVNNYNTATDVFSYSTKTQRGGKIKSLGLLANYFESTDFMEDQSDFYQLSDIYRVAADLEEGSAFSEEELDTIRDSGWYNINVSESEIQKRIDHLDKWSREFVHRNKTLIGRISDETFLKVMALGAAIEYNKIFFIGYANSYEIYNLSNDDILRLAIAQPELVMKDSPLSFARFVYEVGRSPAIIAASVLSGVLLVSTFLKPLITLFLLLVFFISLFVFKLLLRQKAKSIGGYIYSLIAICVVNITYALLLKLTMYLPRVITLPTVCILIQIVLQVMYIYLLLGLTIFIFRDWRNLGYDTFASMPAKIIDKFHHNKMLKRNKGGFEVTNKTYPIDAQYNVFQRQRAEDWKKDSHKSSGENYLDQLRERQKRRLGK